MKNIITGIGILAHTIGTVGVSLAGLVAITGGITYLADEPVLFGLTDTTLFRAAVYIGFSSIVTAAAGFIAAFIGVTR